MINCGMGKMGREQRRILNRNCPILVWRANRQGEKGKVNIQMDNTLALIRKLSEESRTGLLFCYKALKKYDYDYQKTLDYLRSDAFKRSYEMHKRR